MSWSPRQPGGVIRLLSGRSDQAQMKIPLHGAVNVAWSLFTSLLHGCKVQGICQEYMNVALTVGIYAAFNSKGCLIYQWSSLTCHMILLMRCADHHTGHTPLCVYFILFSLTSCWETTGKTKQKQFLRCLRKVFTPSKPFPILSC